ncbi:uncharacterized protein MONBRDRAFT_11095 [Monosiga brevicollis MX1]|uniref:Uncharacterized protein n=1 Tax=Monosiga brevicollis TaxID=81824 RepID=A9V870_MONBE|nr:uncharacterized protein MONBRDRAFT_11095 [Monosiga brevicollis MX1]EDQ86219.1 predicted protein [Monosiga brevicollis MX1]|eukprot:XP_001748889.1 hypothetical protein [Monosiga brevicollis MX1]
MSRGDEAARARDALLADLGLDRAVAAELEAPDRPRFRPRGEASNALAELQGQNHAALAHFPDTRSDPVWASASDTQWRLHVDHLLHSLNARPATDRINLITPLSCDTKHLWSALAAAVRLHPVVALEIPADQPVTSQILWLKLCLRRWRRFHAEALARHALAIAQANRFAVFQSIDAAWAQWKAAFFRKTFPADALCRHHLLRCHWDQWRKATADLRRARCQLHRRTLHQTLTKWRRFSAAAHARTVESQRWSDARSQTQALHRWSHAWLAALERERQAHHQWARNRLRRWYRRWARRCALDRAAQQYSHRLLHRAWFAWYHRLIHHQHTLAQAILWHGHTHPRQRRAICWAHWRALLDHHCQRQSRARVWNLQRPWHRWRALTMYHTARIEPLRARAKQMHSQGLLHRSLQAWSAVTQLARLYHAVHHRHEQGLCIAAWSRWRRAWHERQGLHARMDRANALARWVAQRWTAHVLRRRRRRQAWRSWVQAVQLKARPIRWRLFKELLLLERLRLQALTAQAAARHVVTTPAPIHAHAALRRTWHTWRQQLLKSRQRQHQLQEAEHLRVHQGLAWSWQRWRLVHNRRQQLLLLESHVRVQRQQHCLRTALHHMLAWRCHLLQQSAQLQDYRARGRLAHSWQWWRSWMALNRAARHHDYHRRQQKVWRYWRHIYQQRLDARHALTWHLHDTLRRWRTVTRGRQQQRIKYYRLLHRAWHAWYSAWQARGVQLQRRQLLTGAAWSLWRARWHHRQASSARAHDHALVLEAHLVQRRAWRCWIQQHWLRYATRRRAYALMHWAWRQWAYAVQAQVESAASAQQAARMALAQRAWRAWHDALRDRAYADHWRQHRAWLRWQSAWRSNRQNNERARLQMEMFILHSTFTRWHCNLKRLRAQQLAHVHAAQHQRMHHLIRHTWLRWRHVHLRRQQHDATRLGLMQARQTRCLRARALKCWRFNARARPGLRLVEQRRARRHLQHWRHLLRHFLYQAQLALHQQNKMVYMHAWQRWRLVWRTTSQRHHHDAQLATQTRAAWLSRHALTTLMCQWRYHEQRLALVQHQLTCGTAWRRWQRMLHRHRIQKASADRAAARQCLRRALHTWVKQQSRQLMRVQEAIEHRHRVLRGHSVQAWRRYFHELSVARCLEKLQAWRRFRRQFAKQQDQSRQLAALATQWLAHQDRQRCLFAWLHWRQRWQLVLQASDDKTEVRPALSGTWDHVTLRDNGPVADIGRDALPRAEPGTWELPASTAAWALPSNLGRVDEEDSWLRQSMRSWASTGLPADKVRSLHQFYLVLRLKRNAVILRRCWQRWRTLRLVRLHARLQPFVLQELASSGQSVHALRASSS